MFDVQNGPSEVPLPIDRVGVKNLKIPLIVQDRYHGKQHTTAHVDLSVDLPAQFKGTHMSRFLEALSSWSGVLNYGSFKNLLSDIKKGSMPNVLICASSFHIFYLNRHQ